MRHILVFLIVACVGFTDGSIRRRLRRQVLPSQHIQVHSMDSKVSLDDLITVVSTDSRVELSEKNVNGTIWSDKSKVQFDTYDTFVNATAEVAESIMNILNCAFIHGRSLESTLFMTTNRTSDGHTYLNHQMYDNTNVSIRDEGVQIQGIGGRRVGVEAQTWEKYLEKTMTLRAANNPTTGERELMLSIVAPLYNIEACFVGAMIYIEFGDKLIQIDPDFTRVRIYTQRYLVDFTTKDLKVPYDVTLSNEEITVRCPGEKTTVFVQPGGVNVHVEEFSRMQLDRGGGEMTIAGNPLHADTVRVISLSVLLSLANDGHVRADTTKSEILVQTPVQNVGLTAAHHDIQVFGGVPHLLVEAGNACVEVTASNGMPTSITLLPPFAPPEDRYLTIGPYQAINVTAMPVLFPEPLRLNVTQSPLDGCGGQIGGIPRNQTQRPPTNIPTTLTPATYATHPIVTYYTVQSQGRTQSTTPGSVETTTIEMVPITPSIGSVTEGVTESVTGTVTENVFTLSPDLITYITPVEVTTSTETIGPTNTPEVTTETPFPTLISTTEWTSTTEILPTPDESLLTTSEQPSQVSTSDSLEQIPTVLPGETTPQDTTTTESYPFPTDFPIFETTTQQPGDIPTPSDLPIQVETTTPQSGDIPTPSDFPIGGEITTPLPGDIPTPSDLPIQGENTTQPITDQPEQPISSTSSTGETEGIPFPSPLPTDEFVIAHWFSTEDSGEKTTTEAIGIGITATIGSVNVVTNTPVEGPDIPTPAPLGGLVSTIEPAEFPSPGPVIDITTIPTLPPISMGEKMLILKMRVPDGVDVNSPEFARNVSMSLKRLVRATTRKLKKRVRRNAMTIVDNKYVRLAAQDNTENEDYNSEDDDGDETNSTTKINKKRIEETNQRIGSPVKVDGIVKYHNVTQVTFSFKEFGITQAEMEKALYELDPTELNEYFPFPTTEHIAPVTQSYIEVDVEDEGEGTYPGPLLVACVIFVVLILIAVPILLAVLKPDPSTMMSRMSRHFSKYTAPAHSSTENAFERQSV